MQKASELTIEQIESILQDMDWTEIHKARVFGDYGQKIVLHTDGEFSTQDQGTYYQDPDAAGVISYLNCWGLGNIDTTDYTEGWTKAQTDEDGIETGMYVVDYGYEDEDEGKVLELSEVIEKAIEEGCWDYDDEIIAVLENVEQERDMYESIRENLS